MGKMYELLSAAMGNVGLSANLSAGCARTPCVIPLCVCVSGCLRVCLFGRMAKLNVTMLRSLLLCLSSHRLLWTCDMSMAREPMSHPLHLLSDYPAVAPDASSTLEPLEPLEPTAVSAAVSPRDMTHRQKEGERPFLMRGISVVLSSSLSTRRMIMRLQR
jgi:hypothetical protein